MRRVDRVGREVDEDFRGERVLRRRDDGRPPGGEVELEEQARPVRKVQHQAGRHRIPLDLSPHQAFMPVQDRGVRAVQDRLEDRVQTPAAQDVQQPLAARLGGEVGQRLDLEAVARLRQCAVRLEMGARVALLGGREPVQDRGQEGREAALRNAGRGSCPPAPGVPSASESGTPGSCRENRCAAGAVPVSPVPARAWAAPRTAGSPVPRLGRPLRWVMSCRDKRLQGRRP